MMGRVKNLASLMRMRKEQEDEKLVLMLGAGASLSSGVPSTTTIMTELLAANDNDSTGGDIAQRFDQLWKRTPDATRRGYLTPYLERDATPSVGYQKLAELIKAGYFDVILSFNFDQLLERALQKASPALQQFICALHSDPSQGVASATAILQFLGQRAHPDWLANQLGRIL